MQTAGCEQYAMVQQMMMSDRNPAHPYARLLLPQQNLHYPMQNLLYPHPFFSYLDQDRCYPHQQPQVNPVLEDDSSENQSIFVDRASIAGGAGDEEKPHGKGNHYGGAIWEPEETLALLRIRAAMDLEFRESGFHNIPWEAVSRRLRELGYNRDAKSCEEHFESRRHCEFLAAPQTAFNGIGSICKTVLQSTDAAVPKDSSEDTEKVQQLVSKKKRKRTYGRQLDSMKIFFEDMVKKLLESQEALNNRFMEEIKRRDEERLKREESWKQQQMERLSREAEIRAKEQALASTREAAIVSLLQKISSQACQFTGEIRSSAAPSEIQNPIGGAVTDGEQFDQNSRRWPEPEVQALIRIRTAMDARFQAPGVKVGLWEEISIAMAALGFPNRGARRCKEKWENINKYFRKTRENRKMPRSAKSCPYFEQLDSLYSGNHLLSSWNKCSRQQDDKSSSLGSEQDNNTDDAFNGAEFHRTSITSQCNAIQDSPKVPESAAADEFSNNTKFSSLAKEAMDVTQQHRNLQNAMPEPSEVMAMHNGLLALLDNLTAENNED